MQAQTKLALMGVARRLSDRLPDTLARGARGVGHLVVDGQGERKSALRQLQYAVLHRTSPVLAAPFGAGELLVDSRDREIGRTVFVTGGYERWHMRAAVEHLCSMGRDPAGRLFVDVGANIGTSTVDALVHFGFGRAVCFEPAVRNARLLRANLAWNGLDERAVVHQIALSDIEGTGVLLHSPTNSGDHRFSTGRTSAPAPAGGGLEEPAACRRLDAFVEEGVIDPSDVGLVWIDAQGHEPNILHGARRLLDAKVPVVLEYCPWMLGPSIVDLDAEIARFFSIVVPLNPAAGGGQKDEVLRTPRDLPDLARRFAQRGYADLLLLP